jgi:hypothetical protein
MLCRSTIIIFALFFIYLIIRFSGYSSINIVLTSESARSRYPNVYICYRTIVRVVSRILNSPVLGESGLVHCHICDSSDGNVVDEARSCIKAKLFVNVGGTSAFLGVNWTGWGS